MLICSAAADGFALPTIDLPTERLRLFYRCSAAAWLGPLLRCAGIERFVRARLERPRSIRGSIGQVTGQAHQALYSFLRELNVQKQSWIWIVHCSAVSLPSLDSACSRDHADLVVFLRESGALSLPREWGTA